MHNCVEFLTNELNICKQENKNEPESMYMEKIVQEKNHSSMLCALQLFHTSTDLFEQYYENINGNLHELTKLLLEKSFSKNITTVLLKIVVIPTVPTDIFKNVVDDLIKYQKLTEAQYFELIKAASKYQYDSLTISNSIYCLLICMKKIHSIIHSN